MTTYYEWNERRKNPQHRKVKGELASYELVDFTVADATGIEVTETTLSEAEKDRLFR